MFLFVVNWGSLDLLVVVLNPEHRVVDRYHDYDYDVKENCLVSLRIGGGRSMEEPQKRALMLFYGNRS